MKKAFTLIEALLALAIFSLFGVMLGITANVCMNAIVSMRKNSDEDSFINYALKLGLAESNIETLRSGIDFKWIDDKEYNIRGECEPTLILDMFKLDLIITGDGKDYSESFLVVRKNWYENSNDRDILLEDRKKYIEDKRTGFSKE